MNKESVEKEITSAFLGVSLGTGIGLWEAQAIDGYESKEVRAVNREKDQKKIGGCWNIVICSVVIAVFRFLMQTVCDFICQHSLLAVFETKSTIRYFILHSWMNIQYQD